jgi:iron-sulfur cluster assembly accessory protein
MVSFTDEALVALREYLAAQGDPELFVRLRAEGNGCMGYSFSLMLDDVARRNDRTIEVGGLLVAVDESSALLLSGSLVEYADLAFRIVTARAKSGCETCVGTHREKAGDDGIPAIEGASAPS